MWTRHRCEENQTHLSAARWRLRPREQAGEAPPASPSVWRRALRRRRDSNPRPQSDSSWPDAHCRSRSRTCQTSHNPLVDQPVHSGSARRRKQRLAAPRHWRRGRGGKWRVRRSSTSFPTSSVTALLPPALSLWVMWPDLAAACSTWGWSWGRRRLRAATSCCCRGRSPGSLPRRSRRCWPGNDSGWCSPDLWTALQRGRTDRDRGQTYICAPQPGTLTFSLQINESGFVNPCLLTCVQALVDVIRVERVMKLVGRAANQIVRFVSHQLCHPGNTKMGEKQQN